MIVYADVLFLMNFSLDYLILYLVSKGIQRGNYLGLCAFCGGIYSVLSMKISLLGEPFFQILWAVLITVFAFKPQTVRSFFQSIVLLFAVSFVVCGMLYAMISVTGRGKLINGAIYFDYSLWQFFLLTLVCRFFFFPVIQWILSVVTWKVEKICILNQGKCVIIEGIVDTGCSLREPLTGFPVMVAEYEAISEVLSEEFRDVLRYDSLDSVPERIYQVPFSTVGKEKGMMMAFLPDSVTVIRGRKRTVFQHVLVGVVQKKLGGEQNYSALLPPVMTI